jgi:DNA-binding IclR family transcriptional regulator
MLFRGGRPVRVLEASAELGIGRSTAHRLLATLEHRGFVRQEPRTRAYLVGDGLIDLGRSVVRETQLEALAQPELQALAARIGESAHLAVLRGAQVAYVACVESAQILRTGSHVGTMFPAHATASGKAILAELPDAAVRRLYAAETIARLRRNTVHSWSDLRAALDDVRRLGYATNFEETEGGVNAVAVAIKDASGHVHGAITVTGPSSRFRRTLMKPCARDCRRVAERIAAHIV